MYFGALPYKTKQFFFLVIKLSIVVGAFYFIYNKLMHNDALDFQVFIDFLVTNNAFSLKNIAILILLSFGNWFLEILKWQQLVSIITSISFYNALKQHFSGQTTSLFTPNRIGDYATKTLYYSKQFRKRILLLNLIGNSMQMAVTTILGCIGFVLFYNKYQIELSFLRLSRFLVIIITVLIFSVFGVTQKRYKIRGFTLDKIFTFIKHIPLNKHLKVFTLALLRYAIFSFQFYVLLSIFGISVTYYNAMIVITTLYLTVSVIPTVFIFDVLIRGSVAIYLFSIVGVNDLTILSISTLMWVLNFVLPSIIGSIFVLNFKTKKVLTNTKSL